MQLSDYLAIAYLLAALSTLLGVFLSVNPVVPWKNILVYRRQISDHLKRIHHKKNSQTDRQKIIAYVAMYVYYDGFMMGRGLIWRTRTFLVGLWRWVVFPLCILLFIGGPVLAISGILRPEYAGVFLVFILLWGMIILLFRFFFKRLGKMKDIIPVTPSKGIKTIEGLL